MLLSPNAHRLVTTRQTLASTVWLKSARLKVPHRAELPVGSSAQKGDKVSATVERGKFGRLRERGGWDRLCHRFRPIDELPIHNSLLFGRCQYELLQSLKR